MPIPSLSTRSVADVIQRDRAIDEQAAASRRAAAQGMLQTILGIAVQTGLGLMRQAGQAADRKSREEEGDKDRKSREEEGEKGRKFSSEEAEKTRQAADRRSEVEFGRDLQIEEMRRTNRLAERDEERGYLESQRRTQREEALADDASSKDWEKEFATFKKGLEEPTSKEEEDKFLHDLYGTYNQTLADSMYAGEPPEVAARRAYSHIEAARIFYPQMAEKHLGHIQPPPAPAAAADKAGPPTRAPDGGPLWYKPWDVNPFQLHALPGERSEADPVVDSRWGTGLIRRGSASPTPTPAPTPAPNQAPSYWELFNRSLGNVDRGIEALPQQLYRQIGPPQPPPAVAPGAYNIPRNVVPPSYGDLEGLGVPAVIRQMAAQRLEEERQRRLLLGR